VMPERDCAKSQPQQRSPFNGLEPLDRPACWPRRSEQPGNSGGALVDARGKVVGIVAAKLDASTALAATVSLPENVNYAVKSSLLLSFLGSVPDVDYDQL